MTKKVLGFDVSSTTIGWALLEINEDNGFIKLIEADYHKPIKTGNVIENILHTRNRIKSIIDKSKPDYIAIEDIIKFMKGKTTANTIIMLASFNRMVCLLANDYLQKSPELLNVMTIRHGLKVNKIFPKKEDMPELVANHLGITFPYQYNKKGNIKPENNDVADGIAVALYYSFVITGKIKTKAKKEKVKKDKNGPKRSA